MAALGSKYFNNPKAAYFQLPGSSAKNEDKAGAASPPSLASQTPPSPALPETPAVEAKVEEVVVTQDGGKGKVEGVAVPLSSAKGEGVGASQTPP